MLYESLALLVVALVAFFAGRMMSSGSSGMYTAPSPSDLVPSEISADPEPVPPGPDISAPGVPNFFDDRLNQNTLSPLGDSYPGGACQVGLPTCQRRPSGCMLGCSPCSPLCSGEGNPCMITAPVPSGVWQPQSASTVQYRLRTGNYVPAYCPQGSFALQKAPACSNLSDIHGDTSPKQVTCYTAKHPLESAELVASQVPQGLNQIATCQ